jgi:hypothetical protein
MNRRETIALVGGGLLAGGAVGAANPAAAAHAPLPALKLDLANPHDVALIYRKLAWVAGDGLGFWWLRGRRYCAVPPTYIAFWDMLIGYLFKVRDIDADTYSVTTIATTFYTDIATGELLETFHNPVTGKDVKITPLSPRPIEQHYGIHGQLLQTPMNSMPGSTSTRSAEPGPAFIEGDDIWVRSDNAARLVFDDITRPPLQVEDLSTYFGSLRDVANPAAKAIAAGEVFTDLLSFPAWLEMGDRNGHFFSRCFGRKVFSIDAMPKNWQRFMAERHPEILRDPSAALGA